FDGRAGNAGRIDRVDRGAVGGDGRGRQGGRGGDDGGAERFIVSRRQRHFADDGGGDRKNFTARGRGVRGRLHHRRGGAHGQRHDRLRFRARGGAAPRARRIRDSDQSAGREHEPGVGFQSRLRGPDQRFARIVLRAFDGRAALRARG